MTSTLGFAGGFREIFCFSRILDRLFGYDVFCPTAMAMGTIMSPG